MMINYKKSLLSVAAAAALATTSLTAGYVPLTTTTHDNEWVIFGVSGINTDGTPATEDGIFTISASNKTRLIDDIVDDIEATGMDTGTGDLVQVKAYDDINIEVRIDTTYVVDGSSVDVLYLDTDPIRTIYVKHGSDTPNFAVSYKASLEGKRLEYSVDGSKAYFIDINYENTFNNPIQGLQVQGNPAVIGNEQNLWTEDSSNSAMDYDFFDNPTLSDGWIIGKHKEDATALGKKDSTTSLRVYTYDAPNAKWEIYDSRNVAGTNDFNNVVAGKAYWAKVDTALNKETGVVLGNPKLTTADYVNAGLTDGWNFIAFDAQNSSIRNSASGMLITTDTGGDDFTITDSSGNHTITITGQATHVLTAAHINATVSSAKLTGDLPSTFELRAFPTSAINQIALIANKKFTIKDPNDEISAATTLTGGFLIDPSDIEANAPADPDGVGAMTRYGEYAMVIQPLVSAVPETLASNMTTKAASIQILGKTPASDTPIPIVATTATDAALELDAHTDIKATAINLAIDGTPTEVLLASTSPFSIRDHTFTRVYQVDKTGAVSGNSILDFSGGVSATTTLAYADVSNADGPTNALAVVVKLDAVVPAGEISAEVVATKNQIVIVSDKVDSAKFLMTESADGDGNPRDFLQAITGTTDLSKGAVKNVYSLNFLSKIALSPEITIDVDQIVDDQLDTIRFDYQTEFGEIVGTVLEANPDRDLEPNLSVDPDNLFYFDLLRDTINADLIANGFEARATHDYDLATGDPAQEFDDSIITITGPDVKSVSYNIVNDEAAATETFTVDFTGTVANAGTTITFDGILTTLADLDTDNGIATKVQLAVTADPNWTATVALNVVTFTRASGHWVDTIASDFVIADTGSDDTIAVVATMNAITVQGRTGGVTAGIVTGATSGIVDISPDTDSGDLAKDLKYNSILTPDYVMNGPLYTMRDNNMTLKALVTGTTDLATGTVSWESIDLTRKPSEWLDSQDYNLFDVDALSGYWAYLTPDATDNPITIETPLVTASYQHHFDVDSTDIENYIHTTHNYFNGDIEVNVNGLSDYDTRTSSRVTATIGGETFELTKDALDPNKFNGTINVFEANGVSENKNYEVLITVADGLGNNYSQSFSSATNDAVLDNEKPDAPTVSILDGELTISSADATVAGFYVFASSIPEKATASKALAVLGSAGGQANGGCSTQDPSLWNDPATGITVIAVDGLGTINNGNISDASVVQFMPIMKNRALVIDRNDAGDVEASTGGNLFDSNCAVSGPIPAETGVTVTAITPDTTVKLAYASFGANANNDNPVTVYVSSAGSAGTIAKIMYPEEYAGTTVFVDIEGLVYGYVLPTKAEMDNGDTGVSSADPVNLDTLDATNPKTGITL